MTLKNPIIMLPYLKGQERNVGIVLDLILCLIVGMTRVTTLDLLPCLLNHCVQNLCTGETVLVE